MYPIAFHDVFLPMMLKHLLYFVCAIVILLGCKPQVPVITPTENPFEVLPSVFRQNVLMESFVSETNAATLQHAIDVAQLKSVYGQRLILVNFHEDDWLETPYTDLLTTMLGGLIATPRAALNRTPANNALNGETNYTLLSKPNWTNAIDQSLIQDAQLCMALESTNSSTTKGQLQVYIARKTPILGDTRIGMYLVQDSLAALFQVGATDVFKHNHVVSKTFPDDAGIAIDLKSEIENPTINRYTFEDVDLQQLDQRNLTAVVFIYRYDTDFRNIKILNVQSVKWGGNKYWDQ